MTAYQELVQALDQLVTVYRHLLESVRKENEVLVRADTEKVAELNLTKEKLIIKVRELDQRWHICAHAISVQLKMNNPKPTLLELASHYEGEDAEKLERLHSVLNLLVSRISDINKKNEALVQAMLSHISGAMSSITKTLNENPTYKNSGNWDADNKDAQGRLVQREV